MAGTAGPIRVAISNDYEIVVRGLHRVLAPHPQIEVVELNCLTDPLARADIVLFDSFAPARPQVEELRRLVARPNVGHVVVFSWDAAPAQVAAALEAGAHGYLSKSLPGVDLVRALVRVHAGDVVVDSGGEPPDAGADVAGAGLAWPGQDVGLTSRESEVLGLITQGRTNADIARELYLSPNSVKSYIRTAYRKIGAERRSQAVAWGFRHGFDPVLLRQQFETQDGVDPGVGPSA